MDEEIRFTPWGEIALFHNLVKMVSLSKSKAGTGIVDPENPEELLQKFTVKVIQRPVIYKGKVKLHGSNGGIALLGNKIRAQSRNQFIEKSGFGRIVFENNENYFKALGNAAKAHNWGQVGIFGEYCGPKVQKGVALSQLKFDIFAIFAIDIGGEIIIEPDHILEFMTQHKTLQMPSNVFVLPWHTPEIPMDLNLAADDGCAESLAQIEESVTKIDEVDPWVKETFGIEGPGEGLVLYPVSLQEESQIGSPYKSLNKGTFKKFAFKAKGEQHRVVAAKSSVQVNPTAAASVDAFVNLMCPEARLRQGAGEVAGEGDVFDLKKMKAFIDWMAKDVEKEGKAELEASGLEWENVRRPIGKKASQWYTEKAKETMKSNATGTRVNINELLEFNS